MFYDICDRSGLKVETRSVPPRDVKIISKDIAVVVEVMVDGKFAGWWEGKSKPVATLAAIAEIMRNLHNQWLADVIRWVESEDCDVSVQADLWL
jgi:hypothetical protein